MAAKLLIEDKMNVGQACYDSGFPNLVQFQQNSLRQLPKELPCPIKRNMKFNESKNSGTSLSTF